MTIQQVTDQLNRTSKKCFVEITENHLFRSEDGYTMQREYGKTPNGNPMAGRWVLRDAGGTLVNFDQYSNDLAERNNMDLKWKEDDNKKEAGNAGAEISEKKDHQAMCANCHENPDKTGSMAACWDHAGACRELGVNPQSVRLGV